MQVMDMSYKRGYQANCSSISNSAVASGGFAGG